MNEQLMELFRQNMAQGNSSPENQQMATLMQNMLSQKMASSGASKRRPSDQYRKLRKSRDKWKRYASGLSSSVNYFAELLGACPVCFSNDSHCKVCEGVGIGEFSEPDIESLLQLVSPIFEQAGLVVVQNVPEEIIQNEKENN